MKWGNQTLTIPGALNELKEPEISTATNGFNGNAPGWTGLKTHNGPVASLKQDSKGRLADRFHCDCA